MQDLRLRLDLSRRSRVNDVTVVDDVDAQRRGQRGGKNSMELLSTPRNCGLQALNEILRSAAARGVTIRPISTSASR
ncbi:MAG: hypothetical protein JO141_20525 [Bradyrhizobium sp.]|nr:hypothetical protein [Bradyrhizobium sp.]